MSVRAATGRTGQKMPNRTSRENVFNQLISAKLVGKYVFFANNFGPDVMQSGI